MRRPGGNAIRNDLAPDAGDRLDKGRMDEAEPPRPRRLRKRLLIPLVLLLLAFGLVWAERRAIVRHYVDDELTRRGISAGYVLSDIGPFTQRLEKLVIGDPASPDLSADLAELHLSWGLNGPEVSGIVARGVRLHGRLVDGSLRLGSLDKLMPAPSGKPFSLPDLTVELADARMRLDTDAGQIGLTLDGKGNLAKAFSGRLMAHAPRLVAGDCGMTGLLAPVDVHTGPDGIGLEGPVQLGRLQCGDMAMLANLTSRTMLRLSADLQRLTGNLSLSAGTGRLADIAAKDWGFAGQVEGDLSKGAGELAGDVSFTEASAPIDFREALRGNRESLAATPLAPLAPPLIDALLRLASRFDGKARLTASYGSGADIRLSDISLQSGSEPAAARLTLTGGRGVGWSPQGGVTADGAVRLAGGGFPDMSGRLSIADGKGEGRLAVAPYAAGNARLALAPMRIVADGNAYAVETAATIDGPLGDGRITGLSLQIIARIGGDGSLAVNPRCAPLTFRSLNVAGLALTPARLPLCPTGEALVSRRAGGTLAGGAAIAGLRLSGRMGGSPLSMASRALRFDIGTPGFTADAVAVRLGQGDAVTRLDVARLTGRTSPTGLAGDFEGAAGKIAAVPLLLSDGRGDWQLADADLALRGHLRVADEAGDPRFNPLESDDVRLTLVDGRVHATGQLREPNTNVALAAVAIDHDLSATTGHAQLDVPGITFGRALQPERLTRLTLGVVANVEGTVSGQGRIDWNGDGVTSTGDFATDSLDLAAAFGPVKGLSGQIHFSDLLGLETPPGQEVRLAEVNPGVAVNDGLIRYQLLTDQRVHIESGHWPFSGGELFLEPTTLDFAKPVARNMTFRVAGLDAAQFIQRFEFDNIAGTGIFDGTLPMVFDDSGGRIENGRLVVRQGGGTLAYVGELSNEDLGTYGKMAFDALKSIRYDNLAIDLNGNLDGEIVSQIAFVGINEQPIGGERLEGMAQELTGLPFKFNITVRAPFRGLVSTATNFVDPTGLIRAQRDKEAEPPIQGQESKEKQCCS